MIMMNFGHVLRSLMLAAIAIASSAYATDQRMNAWSTTAANQVAMRPGLGVAAGQAQIEQALLTLVPPPYRIQLADNIDRSTVLSWGAAEDWMLGLKQAVEPHGLLVVADWNANVLTVSKKRVKAEYSKPSRVETMPGVQVQERISTSANEVRSVVAPAATTEKAKPAKDWSVLPSDGSLSRALMRWSREAGTQISYEAPSDLAAVSVSYSGDFWTALEGLLADTANGGYPLHGCQYNNITRILHISQACDR